MTIELYNENMRGFAYLSQSEIVVYIKNPLDCNLNIDVRKMLYTQFCKVDIYKSSKIPERNQVLYCWRDPFMNDFVRFKILNDFQVAISKPIFVGKDVGNKPQLQILQAGLVQKKTGIGKENTIYDIIGGIPLEKIDNIKSKSEIQEIAVRRAKNTVLSYLHSKGINSQRLETVKVFFVDDVVEWYKLAFKMDALGKSATQEQSQNIEGLTSTDGTIVYMNGKNFTLAAIVHELFHVVSCPGLGKKWLWNCSLEEPLTEFFALTALGMSRRLTYHGDGILYAKRTNIIMEFIAEFSFAELEVLKDYIDGNVGETLKMLEEYVGLKVTD